VIFLLAIGAGKFFSLLFSPLNEGVEFIKLYKEINSTPSGRGDGVINLPSPTTHQFGGDTSSVLLLLVCKRVGNQISNHSVTTTRARPRHTDICTHRMLIIGLTGSIATGKSTVSKILSSPPHNLPIIDADVLARKVVEPGTAGYRAIVNYFGSNTPDLLLPCDENGKGRPLNRPALGRRVFGDSEERKRDRMILNRIIHPAVRWEVYKSLLYNYLRGQWAVVLDVPLLFESGMDMICGTVIVVGVSNPAVQMERLRLRDPHLTAEDAENRVRSQGDVAGKVAKAEFRGTRNARGVIVWNDSDRKDLEHEVYNSMRGISSSSPRWWAWILLLAPPLGVTIAFWNLVLNFSTHRSWNRKVKREKARL